MKDDKDVWHPAETMPLTPDHLVDVQEVALYRWFPYKEKSPQFRNGIKGRWQRYDGCKWLNSDQPKGQWRVSEQQRQT